MSYKVKIIIELKTNHHKIFIMHIWSTTMHGCTLIQFTTIKKTFQFKPVCHTVSTAMYINVKICTKQVYKN